MSTQRQVTVLPFAVLLTVLSALPRVNVAEASIPTINKDLVRESITEAASASLAKLSNAQLRQLQNVTMPSIQVLEETLVKSKRLFVAQDLGGESSNDDNTSVSTISTCYTNCYSEHNDCGGNDI